MSVIQFPNDRGPRSELDCRVVDVGSGLADDIEEFGNEAEVIGSGVEKGGNVGGYLKPTLSLHREASSNP